MVAFRTYTPDGTTDRVRCAIADPFIFLSEILNVEQSLPLGTTLELEETVTIRTELTNPALVGVDLRYYAPRYYLGNWELQDVAFGIDPPSGVEYPKANGLQGEIWSFNQQIHYKRRYPVRGKQFDAPFVSATVETDQCNFALQNAVPLPPPAPPLVYTPGYTDSLFKSRVIYRDPQLGDSSWRPRLDPLYLFLYPGVKLVAAELRVETDILLYADEPTAATTQCFLGGSCNAEFDAFVRSINQGEPIDVVPIAGGFGVFSSESTCIASPPGFNCGRQTFTCTNNEVREYWIPNAN